MLEHCRLYGYRIHGKPTYTLKLRQATVEALGVNSQEPFKLTLICEVRVRAGIPFLILTPGAQLGLNDILEVKKP